MSVSDEQLRDLAARLTQIRGVVGVVLGGSRARGEHTPESDLDLGLYYRPDLDVDALQHLARAVDSGQPTVTAPGEWGPWVDGGSWLNIAGTAVDWIYRDLDRVNAAWEEARAGRFHFHNQVGHPLGFPDFAYVGELALAVILADPRGELTTLRERLKPYPVKLRHALVHKGLGEALFTIGIARKAISRVDTTYIAGCLFRAFELCAHALHAHAGRWLINEKGAVIAAGRTPGAPRAFADRANRVLGGLGNTADELATAVAVAADLVQETIAACKGS